jgi:hypothetical protein
VQHADGEKKNVELMLYRAQDELAVERDGH